MILTEEDAKEKACCNWAILYMEGPPKRPCLASGCMSWRWFDDALRCEARPRRSDRRGFCGLAGRPKWQQA